MESLSELLEGFITSEGVSQREFERRASKLGHRISHTQVGAIRQGRHTGRYERQTLEAICAVTGYSRERVYAAARVRLPGRPFASELPPGVDYLGQDERRAIIGIIRVLLKDDDPMALDNVEPLIPVGKASRHPGLESVTRFDSQPPDVDSPASRAVARDSGRKRRGEGGDGDRSDG